MLYEIVGYARPEINAYIGALIEAKKGKPVMSDLTLIASSPELMTRLRHMNDAIMKAWETENQNV